LDLPELNAEEALGRSLVSSKYARRAMGSGAIHPWVFLERLDAPSVSMDRLDHASSGVMAEVGRKLAAARTPTRHFWGWAVPFIAPPRRGERLGRRPGRTTPTTPTSSSISVKKRLGNSSGFTPSIWPSSPPGERLPN